MSSSHVKMMSAAADVTYEAFSTFRWRPGWNPSARDCTAMSVPSCVDITNGDSTEILPCLALSASRLRDKTANVRLSTILMNWYLLRYLPSLDKAPRLSGILPMNLLLSRYKMATARYELRPRGNLLQSSFMTYPVLSISLCSMESFLRFHCCEVQVPLWNNERG